MSDDLQGKSQEILDFIKLAADGKGGIPRRYGRSARRWGLKSTSTVHGHLDRLEKKGHIRRDRTKPRAIEILDEDTLFFFQP